MENHIFNIISLIDYNNNYLDNKFDITKLSFLNYIKKNDSLNKTNTIVILEDNNSQTLPIVSFNSMISFDSSISSNEFNVDDLLNKSIIEDYKNFKNYYKELNLSNNIILLNFNSILDSFKELINILNNLYSDRERY